MGKYFKALAALGAAALLAVSAPKEIRAQDSDGCYQASGCLSGSSRWSGSTLIVTLRNTCNAGVYARVCTRRSNGSEDCGASWIRGGSSYNFQQSSGDGDARWTWVGSVNRDSSWVCSGKVSGWNESLF